MIIPALPERVVPHVVDVVVRNRRPDAVLPHRRDLVCPQVMLLRIIPRSTQRKSFQQVPTSVRLIVQKIHSSV